MRVTCVPIVGVRLSLFVFAGLCAMTDTAGAQLRCTLTVKDQRSLPIPHAVLEVEGGRTFVADDSGHMTLLATKDSLKVAARRIGFTPYFGRLACADGGTTELTLTSIAQRLDTVVVKTTVAKSMLERTGFYDRVQRAQRGAFNAEFMTPEELDARPGTRTSDLFFGRRFVFPVRRGRSTFLTGRGGCAMNVFLDGMLVRPDGGSNGVVQIDDVLGPSSIAAIEMYASANQAPAELIPLVGAAQKGACGVVAIWTGGRR